LSNARFESLRTSATERMDVNQIFGSPAFGLYSPLAIASARARIFSCDITPITIVFISYSLDRSGNHLVHFGKKIFQQRLGRSKRVGHALVGGVPVFVVIGQAPAGKFELPRRLD